MSEAKPAPAGSDLSTRVAVGTVLIAVAIVATYFGGWWFRALAVAAAALMVAEWADIHRVPRLDAWVSAALLAVLLLGAAEYLYPVGGGDYLVDDTTGESIKFIDAETFQRALLGFGAIGLLALAIALTTRRLAMIGGAVYIGIPTLAMLGLNWAWPILVFWVFVVTWATDILAYFAGRAIGGPKLAPRISPNKTWSGLLGGIAGAALFGWLMARQFDMGSPFLWIGGLMGLIAQAGDLYESWVKRRAGVKDSGALLPGHGGVLDRLDGLLAVALATILLLMAGAWTG